MSESVSSCDIPMNMSKPWLISEIRFLFTYTCDWVTRWIKNLNLRYSLTRRSRWLWIGFTILLGFGFIILAGFGFTILLICVGGLRRFGGVSSSSISFYTWSCIVSCIESGTFINYGHHSELATCCAVATRAVGHRLIIKTLLYLKDILTGLAFVVVPGHYYLVYYADLAANEFDC